MAPTATLPFASVRVRAKRLRSKPTSVACIRKIAVRSKSPLPLKEQVVGEQDQPWKGDAMIIVLTEEVGEDMLARQHRAKHAKTEPLVALRQRAVGREGHDTLCTVRTSAIRTRAAERIATHPARASPSSAASVR